MSRRLATAIPGSSEPTSDEVVELPELQPAQRALARLKRAIQAGRCPRSLSPLYLHGPTGCGKSHLLASLLDRLGEEHTTLVSTGRELGRLLTQTGGGLEPLTSANVLVVENVATLPASASDGLASVLDRRSVRRAPVVVTALLGPALLTRHSARLRSRLAGGLVLQVPALGLESRVRFLCEQATRQGLHLDTEALAWLGQQVGGSFRQLLGVLTRLADPSREPGSFSLAEVQARLAEAETISEALSVDRIAREVGRFYRVQPARLRGKSRQRAALVPRQVGMYLARLLTSQSLEAIGAYFGGRDHATVLHACRKVEQALELDPELAGAVRTLQTTLG